MELDSRGERDAGTESPSGSFDTPTRDRRGAPGTLDRRGIGIGRVKWSRLIPTQIPPERRTDPAYRVPTRGRGGKSDVATEVLNPIGGLTQNGRSDCVHDHPDSCQRTCGGLRGAAAGLHYGKHKSEP